MHTDYCNLLPINGCILKLMWFFNIYHTLIKWIYLFYYRKDLSVYNPSVHRGSFAVAALLSPLLCCSLSLLLWASPASAAAFLLPFPLLHFLLPPLLVLNCRYCFTYPVASSSWPALLQLLVCCCHHCCSYCFPRFFLLFLCYSLPLLKQQQLIGICEFKKLEFIVAKKLLCC